MKRHYLKRPSRFRGTSRVKGLMTIRRTPITHRIVSKPCEQFWTRDLCVWGTTASQPILQNTIYNFSGPDQNTIVWYENFPIYYWNRFWFAKTCSTKETVLIYKKRFQWTKTDFCQTWVYYKKISWYSFLKLKQVAVVKTDLEKKSHSG